MSLNALKFLYAQKSWANNELFNVLATVPAQHAAAQHTALRTLNHIHVVDRIFRAHLASQPHAYSATNTPDTPTVDELQFATAETDAWYEHYVASLPESALGEQIAFAFTDGDRGLMTREEMLFHVLSHGSYHRGNVGQVLKSIDMAPPRDLLTKFLHHREPARRSA